MTLAETVLAQHQNNKILRKKLNQEDYKLQKTPYIQSFKLQTFKDVNVGVPALGMSETAVCPLFPIADDPSALPFPTSTCSSSSQ